MNVISFSAAGDDGALASLEKKLYLIRDLTTGVAKTDDVKKQEERYVDQTGASRADFYRRKLEVKTGDFDAEDAKQ